MSNLLMQMVPVMIGVYLAFALNNFGEDQKLKSQQATFRVMLQNEIKENLNTVEKAYPYHQKLATDFVDILNSRNLKESFNAYELRGLKPGFVNRSAFDTGLQTGIIQEFDLNLVQKLNRLYAYQDNYKNYNETMINALISRKFPETESEIKSAIISLNMSLKDVLNFESNLQEFYQLALEEL